VLLHFVGIAGNDDFVGAEAERVFLLPRRGGEDDDVGPERMTAEPTLVTRPTIS
jgi:hypothetical protein